MNDLQRKEFDLFAAFTAVCDRLGLPYFLVCGSALGAVKYKGFIPWDDDMDVGMLRGDYERFLREAPALLPEYYFLQSYKSEPAYPSSSPSCGTAAPPTWKRGSLTSKSITVCT